MSDGFSKLSPVLSDDFTGNTANNLESCAKVVAVDKDIVWLEPDIASGCAGCSHSAGCLSALTKKHRLKAVASRFQMTMILFWVNR